MNINTSSKGQQSIELVPAPWIRKKSVENTVSQPKLETSTGYARQLNTPVDLVNLRELSTANQPPLEPVESVPEKTRANLQESSFPTAPKSYEGFRLAPEEQAQTMAENHQSIVKVRESYEKMSAAGTKAYEEMRQIRAEANRSISELWSKAREKRVASQANHFEAWLQMFSKSSEI